jgi:hypothetical protein
MRFRGGIESGHEEGVEFDPRMCRDDTVVVTGDDDTVLHPAQIGIE